MAIAAVVRGTPLHTTTDATSYIMTDAGTPTPNRLLIAKVFSRGGTALATSFTGYGLTWTSVGGVNKTDSDGRLQVYAALTGTSPDSTDPVATWATTRGGASIVVYEVTLDSYPATAFGAFRDQGGGVYVVTGGGTGTSGSFTALA